MAPMCTTLMVAALKLHHIARARNCFSKSTRHTVVLCGSTNVFPPITVHWQLLTWQMAPLNRFPLPVIDKEQCAITNMRNAVQLYAANSGIPFEKAFFLRSRMLTQIFSISLLSFGKKALTTWNSISGKVSQIPLKKSSRAVSTLCTLKNGSALSVELFLCSVF